MPLSCTELLIPRVEHVRCTAGSALSRELIINC